MYKLQNSKKSISVATEWRDTFLRNGVWSGVGFNSVVEGELMMGNDDDIMSTPDKQGRRWINTGYLENSKGKDLGIQAKKVEAGIVYLKGKLYWGFLAKYNLKFHHNKDTPSGYGNLRRLSDILDAHDLYRNEGSLYDEMYELRDQGNLINGDELNKMKADIIKDYMDGIEKLLKKNKKFLDNFRDAAYGVSPEQWSGEWNESVMTNFKIVNVYVDSMYIGEEAAEKYKKHLSKMVHKSKIHFEPTLAGLGKALRADIKKGPK